MSDPLFISRARLSYRRYRGYSAPYIVHQLVADLFADGDRQHLYRVTARAPGRAHVLVLSAVPPNDGVSGHPWGSATQLETKAFDPELQRGMVLDYEIRVNATRIVTYADGKKKRKDVWDAVFEADRDDRRSPHDVYRAYLDRKLQGAARICGTRVTERGGVRAARADRRHPIQFIAANAIGSLVIEDPERFLDLVREGIGRAKAFGCGLLCLSKPGTVLVRHRLALDGH